MAGPESAMDVVEPLMQALGRKVQEDAWVVASGAGGWEGVRTMISLQGSKLGRRWGVIPHGDE